MGKEQAHARRHALYALRRPHAKISCRKRSEPCAECLCLSCVRHGRGSAGCREEDTCPVRDWYAVKQHRFAEHKEPQAVKLDGRPVGSWRSSPEHGSTLPLSGARYPASLVAYCSDDDGWRWWTTWFPRRNAPCSGAWSGNRRLPVAASRPAGIQNPVGDGADVLAVCPADERAHGI